MRSSRAILAFVGFVVLAAAAAAQSMPTSNILTRVLMVQSQYGFGTIFSVDVGNREYWITAKHVLTGAEHPPYGSIHSKTVSLQILNPGASGEQWLPEDFSVIDTGKNIDIVVLAPSRVLLPTAPPSEPLDSSGVSIGADCSFLGFPFGGGWRARLSDGSYWMPFSKHCTVSADTDEPRIWVLDGINNPGFSGGPVVFNTGTEQKIIAVISAYRTEPAEIVSAFQETLHPDGSSKRNKKQIVGVNVNSGFIIAYDIGYALVAIRKNPIGPVVKSR